MQAIVDHHHADVKTASKVRFAEPGATEPEPQPASDAPSPPLADSDEKDNDNKVNIVIVYSTDIALRSTITVVIDDTTVNEDTTLLIPIIL